jgi:hypothetical protein
MREAMKLLGKDFGPEKLLRKLEERLAMRGLAEIARPSENASDVEPRVDPLTFNLHALERHADTTQGLPLETHRGGAGRAILLAKWAFRKTCQVFINEALSRQRVFNGHVRDSYAQLSAEVLKLQREVESLKGAKRR